MLVTTVQFLLNTKEDEIRQEYSYSLVFKPLSPASTPLVDCTVAADTVAAG